MSTARLRPPPARRTRPAPAFGPPRNSAMPLPIAFLDSPVARAAVAIPPRPSATASDAATNRRARSSKVPATSAYRWWIAATSSSSIHPAYIQTGG